MEYLNTVKTQTRRIFENSQVQEVKNHSIFQAKNKNAFYNLKLNKYFGIPIKSYKDSHEDTFPSILGVFLRSKRIWSRNEFANCSKKIKKRFK